MFVPPAVKLDNVQPPKQNQWLPFILTALLSLSVAFIHAWTKNCNQPLPNFCTTALTGPHALWWGILSGTLYGILPIVVVWYSFASLVKNPTRYFQFFMISSLLGGLVSGIEYYMFPFGPITILFWVVAIGGLIPWLISRVYPEKMKGQAFLTAFSMFGIFFSLALMLWNNAGSILVGAVPRV